MLKLKDIYSKIILPACLIFTVICLIMSVILGTDGEYAMAVSSIGHLKIFVFSLLLSLSNLLFSCKMKFIPALILHFIAFMLNIYISFLAFINKGEAGYSPVSVILVFAVFYLIGALIFSVVRAVMSSKREKEDEKNYKRQFR